MHLYFYFCLKHCFAIVHATSLREFFLSSLCLTIYHCTWQLTLIDLSRWWNCRLCERKFYWSANAIEWQIIDTNDIIISAYVPLTINKNYRDKCQLHPRKLPYNMRESSRILFRNRKGEWISAKLSEIKMYDFLFESSS